MSYIHVSSKAVAAAHARTPASETHSPAHPESPASSPRPDHELTQAWSIGVTSATGPSRDFHEPRAPQESCPPEVYIG